LQPEIQIGPLELKTFGLCFAAGFLFAAAVLVRHLKEIGKPPDWAYEIIFAGLVGGVVGSRLDFLLQNWNDVSDDLFGNILSGSGLVWFGGLVGGTVGVVLWAWRRGFLGLQLLDVTAVPLALGYAVGRVGCQLSGDGDYGTESDLPWAMAYPDGTVSTTDEVHPTPIYESLTMGLVALALWQLRGRLAAGVRALSGGCRPRTAARRVHQAQRRCRARPDARPARERGDDGGRRGVACAIARASGANAPGGLKSLSGVPMASGGNACHESH
jgi:phosphatidylglycerol:prolipoprotein diacylglycerol transferase